jgi:diguanylate cyclase (GGDEF)-like protein
VAIANARLFGEVQRLAVTDGLTEINNRRHFFDLAEREWIRTRRYDHPLSAMMLDVDHFKRVNDTFGHATGDSVLRTVAQICRNSLRETDFLGRYGGEEFAIMLPDTDLSAAHATAERLRESIAGTPIHTDKGDLQVTVSIGVASITVDMNSVATLLDRADRGLYIAKDTGRNRVVMT